MSFQVMCCLAATVEWDNKQDIIKNSLTHICVDEIAKYKTRN